MAVGSVEKVSERIRRGTFDVALLRPAGTLLQVVTDEFAVRRIGKVIQPAAVLVYAVVRLDLGWSARTVGLTVVMVVAGAVIAGAIWITTAAATFWTVEGREAANAVTYGGNALTQYPLSLYGEVVRSFAFIVPIAFISYLPSVEVLGKDDPLGVPAALPDGRPIHPEQFSRTFDQLVARHGMPDIRLHDYADLRVMPTRLGNPLQGWASVLAMSA
jgi:ABC-2 type transport system permease protein